MKARVNQQATKRIHDHEQDDHGQDHAACDQPEPSKEALFGGVAMGVISSHGSAATARA